MQQNKTASQRKTINPACWVPTAYFAMGLPFIAINLVSVFMFKDLGISDTQIAFWTSLIMMPWTLKFLWSPFLEMYRTKKFFVLITELLSGVLFGVVAFSLFFDYFFAISISTMAVIAFSGATHDIACDGVYMAELNKEDQAKYIGVQGAFYNVAKLVANGGLVAMAGALAEHFGAIEGASIDANKGAYSSAWMIIFGVIAAIMVLIGIYHIKMLPSTQIPSTTKKTASEVGHELVAVIANFFTKKHIVYYICFIILYRFAEGFVMKIVPLFLKAGRDVGGLGLTEQEIGIYYGTSAGKAGFLTACFRTRFIAGWILYFRTWLEKDFVLLVLCVQSAFYGLHAACHFPTAECASYRRSHCAGVFRIWLRLCGTYLVHDATGGCRPSSDGALCFCIGYHEPGCHVARYDVRICQRLAGL